jgi:hypothetical protein
MVYSGARGTLIYEKNLKSEISCQSQVRILALTSVPSAYFSFNKHPI